MHTSVRHSAGRAACVGRRPVAAFHRPSVLTCAAQPNQDVAQIARARQQLTRELDAAARAEDFALAASIKRQLVDLEKADPLLQLQRKLEDAVQDERYKDAARLKAQLQDLESETGVNMSATTTSDVVTEGVRVHVRSFYIPAASSPDHFLFGYAVTITNEGDRVVQLRNRHWVITDANGVVKEVKGPGVVGMSPILVPGKSFSYESGSAFDTTSGTMEGTYGFVVLDEDSGEFKDTLSVKIGKFLLTTEGETAV